MKGLGEKCLACGAIMRTTQRRRITNQHQEAVLQCYGCRRHWRVDLHFSPVRAYKYSKSATEVSKEDPHTSCLVIDERLNYPDELCLFGDLCPKCSSIFRVRTSRRVSDDFKVFYLVCSNSQCASRAKVEVSVNVF